MMRVIPERRSTHSAVADLTADLGRLVAAWVRCLRRQSRPPVGCPFGVADLRACDWERAPALDGALVRFLARAVHASLETRRELDHLAARMGEAASSSGGSVGARTVLGLLALSLEDVDVALLDALKRAMLVEALGPADLRLVDAAAQLVARTAPERFRAAGPRWAARSSGLPIAWPDAVAAAAHRCGLSTQPDPGVLRVVLSDPRIIHQLLLGVFDPGFGRAPAAMPGLLAVLRASGQLVTDRPELSAGLAEMIRRTRRLVHTWWPDRAHERLTTLASVVGLPELTL